MPSRPTAFATSRSRRLRASLRATGGLEVGRLGREPHQDRVALALAQLGQDVGRRLELELGRARRPSSACRSATTLGRKSATAAAITIASASSAARSTAVAHLFGGLDASTSAPPGGATVPGPRIERHVGPRAERLGGDRDAHLPAGAVADEAHRVDRLVGRARRSRRSGHRPGRRRRRERALDRAEDVLRLGEPADAPRRRRRARPSTGPTKSTPRSASVSTLPRWRGAPHPGVHRGRDHQRAGRLQQRRGEQVIGEPGRELGETLAVAGATTRDVGLVREVGRAGPRPVVPTARCAPDGR